MTNVTAMRLAALAGFLAVALGAFGAHGLKENLTQNGTTTILGESGFLPFHPCGDAFYSSRRKPFFAGAWWSFLTGIVFFSGSLYLLAVTNLKWLGAITPLAAQVFLIGWGWLFWMAGKSPNKTD